MKHLLSKSDISHGERSREDVNPVQVDEDFESDPDLSFQANVSIRENSPNVGTEPELNVSGSCNIPCAQDNHPLVSRDEDSDEEVWSGNNSPSRRNLSLEVRDLQTFSFPNALVMQGYEGSESDDESVVSMTQSYVREATVRRRNTNSWICMFEIMGALEMQGRERGTVENMETSEIEKIDNYLKGFFQQYNENIKEMTKNNYKVIAALGGRYIYYAENKLVRGVLVVIGNVVVENLGLNSHLLSEKCSPSLPPVFKEFHNIHIGHAYPIHTEDVVCIGGNSLRSLLKNWVDTEFYESLHWIIPPTTSKMHMERPKEAEAKKREDLRKNVALIKRMKECVLRNPRSTIDSSPWMTSTPAKIPRRSSKKNQSQYNSMYEYMQVKPGQEYPVKSHHWQIIEIPLNEDGTVNDRAHRMADAIRQKGGVVRREC
ncbi:uncharacterized protein [Palaemon carinicauda]|uniref:uncharacterized protein n=1 Tax=Palaemon carinicauda TaxID=392227 RepID=UPI0035B5DE8D